MRSAPQVLHSSAPDASVFHSAPIGQIPINLSMDGSPPPQGGFEPATSYLQPGFTLTGDLSPTAPRLPPINGAPSPPTARRNSYSTSYTGGSPMPMGGPAATPNVGGFQGARLAAVQRGGPLVGRAGPNMVKQHH